MNTQISYHYGCSLLTEEEHLAIQGGAEQRSVFKDVGIAIGWFFHVLTDICATGYKSLLDADIDLTVLYMYA